MATITSAASGNWSATSTWVGGVVPTAADDVVITSTHLVTADVNINVISITINGGGHTTGNLIITSPIDITCTGANGITLNTTLEAAGAVGGFFRINAAVGTINLYSNLRVTSYSTVSGSPGQFLINIINTAQVNVFGNLIQTQTNSNGGANNGSCININTNNARLNITGNLVSSANSTRNTLYIQSGTGHIINITGNLTTQNGSTINSAATSGALNIIGNINSSVSNRAVNTSTLSVTVGGIVTNVNNLIAVFANEVKVYSTIATQWLFQTETIGVNKTLYDAASSPSVPATSNVRSGVTYASGTLTGTLVVPAANTVTAGVTYDNGTIGTAQNTAASFLTELAASSDPLAVRLKNVATVQTTGDQIAAAL